ncbi:3-deoxy-D-manno-octulosonic acid transferase [Cochlodiniinecator piscidefendens]|uniref:3-deoxy-D-manno-octulosonic acid transferase n=1 Tax=Cochlodiniinecator piscidefendens TaxID=2715756 RepID=UPI001E4FBF18|nr:glycosyltransferase N-terminal domain-containing protein [Cochlodiniinecator piscidefendens]
MRGFLWLYKALWVVLFPVVMLYLLLRSRKDPTYRAHLQERFGLYPIPLKNAVWVHAVSLGEFRSAVPLIQALLAQGEHVVITNFTPAGRREAHKQFSTEIKQGQMSVVWVPFEFDICFRQFFKAFTPKYGLVMEIEYWPQMIASCHKHAVPLFICNGQYPTKSFERDQGKIRAELVTGFAGVMVKSERQADRFRSLGAKNIAITGELRFDQPIPPHLLEAADNLRPQLLARPVVTLASVIAGEDVLYINAIKAARQQWQNAGKTPPLFIYVPRAPERFSETADLLQDAGLNIARRSDVLDKNLTLTEAWPNIDVLLGDSMGEMYFYLSLAQQVIVGGGFHPKGAHNVIEPLAVQKPVLVGPHIWTIEYPAFEAIKAGVVRQLDDEKALIAALSPAELGVISGDIGEFYTAHSGAAQRSLKALPALRRPEN